MSVVENQGDSVVRAAQETGIEVNVSAIGFWTLASASEFAAAGLYERILALGFSLIGPWRRTGVLSNSPPFPGGSGEGYASSHASHVT
jgi:hypothetical protein